MHKKSFLSGVMVAVMAVALTGCWQIAESFDEQYPCQPLGSDQQWDEYRTFGEDDNPWWVWNQRGMRASSRESENSEVVAFAREVPPTRDQEVSISVHGLDLRPAEPGVTSWASVGALVRGSAELGEGGVVQDFSAYNAELVYTDAFGPLAYYLVLWRASDWSFGDPPGNVLILAASPLGPTIDLPVRLTARAEGSTISAIAVQEDATTSSVSVEDATLTEGRVGMISSLIAPVEAAIEVDDFLAQMPSPTEPVAVAATSERSRERTEPSLLESLSTRGRDTPNDPG